MGPIKSSLRLATIYFLWRLSRIRWRVQPRLLISDPRKLTARLAVSSFLTPRAAPRADPPPGTTDRLPSEVLAQTEPPSAITRYEAKPYQLR
jgi:hypothetical protein